MVAGKNNKILVSETDDMGLYKKSSDFPDEKKPQEIEEKMDIVWRNVALFVVLHLAGLYGFYLAFHAKWLTLVWSYVTYVMAGLGITAGAHRLWAHRTYKAKEPLRWLLMFFNNMALQNDVIEWARDHRCHHKWSETDADPHNSQRGLFFSHVGWLCMKKHSEVTKKGKTLDLSDLFNDPVLRFQRKYYKALAILSCFVMPALVPWYFWGEGFAVAFYVSLFRYAITLNFTWMVNSVAHWMGEKPYDKRISPSESLVTSLGALGEGWHNYHHTFPQDYKTSELPWAFNFTTVFIDTCAFIGLAYDRKITSKDAIEKTKLKHGQQAG